MIDNDVVQAAILAQTQSEPTITALLPEGTAGIKELNWKGTDFKYPCIRIGLESQTDLMEVNSSCPSQEDFSFYIFSETASSKEANQIAGKVVSAFRGFAFAKNNVKFVKIRITENIPAIAQDARLWRAQVRCQSIIHST